MSVTVGAGHMRAAEAIGKTIRQVYPAAEVTVLDTFRYASPLVDKLVLGTYIKMLKFSPFVYGFLYRQSEHDRSMSDFSKQKLGGLINKLATPKLAELINRINPQLILCTHPFPLGVAIAMKEKGALNLPLLAAITDFTVHPFWIYPGVSCYFVGAEDLLQHFRGYGIEDSRVRVTGIPIDPAFGLSYDRVALRKNLGLEVDVPTILVLGGGLGMGPLDSVVKLLGNCPARCQLLVVAGTNQTLQRRLERQVSHLANRVKVFGYVGNIHELAAAADLMVGKAGGLTCAEAMAMRLPIFITRPLPGQEERNADFLESTGAAKKVSNIEDLPAIIQSHLAEPARLEEMAQAAVKFSRPDASRAVVEALDEILAVAG
ncbi:MAG: glycosyltransferase [Peptococcaceae bacterium]|nr:MAG: glycosyltransferase [Peptococcaceae bacterium]